MSEEPSLPRLPAVSWDKQSQSFSNNPRKRVRNHRFKHAPPSGFNSSDPAVFSSDDDPALDNYVEGRRKKRYVGSWFQQHPTSSDSAFGGDVAAPPAPQRKRTWARQVDSGVFLGSDGNESDDVTEHMEIPRPRLPQLDRAAVRQVSQAEQAARDKIQACLDQGEETIDFWSMGLEEISNDTMAPLANLSVIPVVTKDVAFEQKDPELKLYLAMNRLTWVPGAIFDLAHLTILSLRGNKLRELPPAISRLHNLKELNLSQNRLRHLPVELLDLFTTKGNLHTLVLHPNPFLQQDFKQAPTQSDGRPSGTFPMAVFHYSEQDASKISNPRFVSQSLGRSPVQLSNTSGHILSDFKLPTDLGTQTVRVEPPEDAANIFARYPDTGRVPSLLEVALRSCYHSSQLNDMSHYMPDGLSHIRKLLERAVQQKEVGGLNCSHCRRPIVVPTVEWVEWREIRTCAKVTADGSCRVNAVPLSRADDERAVPFLHRGCSWRCGPRDEGDATWGVSEGYTVPSEVQEVDSY